MAEQPEVSENEAESGEIRSKLLGRLAVAGVLVAVLLGVLAFFDYLATVPDESEEQVFTKPVPVAPKKAVSQPLTPAENLPTPPEPQKVEAPVEAPPPPQVETHTPAVAESKPEPVLEKRPKLPLTVESAKKLAVPVPAVAPALPPVPEATTAPSNVLPPPPRAVVAAEPVPPRPAARILETRPAVRRVASLFGLPVTGGGFFQRAARRRTTCPADAEWCSIHAGNARSGWPVQNQARG